MTRRRFADALFQGGLATGALVLGALLFLPLLALALTALPADLWRALRTPEASAALSLSLFTTTCSLALVVLLGTPLAWLLATVKGRWVRALEVVAQLPIVVPPAVAGLALLLAFGRRGLFGSVLEGWGVSLSFTTAAVILAEAFVSAPFYVQSAAVAFRRVDGELLDVARVLGAGAAERFFRVAVPLAWPGLLSGAAMAWARALGEFGATLMFAGSFPGRTQTLPLAVYGLLESDLGVAQALALVQVVVAFALLMAVRAASRRGAKSGAWAVEG